MKKIIKSGLAILSIIASSSVFIACDKDDEDSFEMLLPIAGDYHGAETCDAAGGVPSADYDVHIYNSANDPNTFWIENAYGLGLKLKATWDGNNGFTLPTQEISYKASATVTLKGKISGTGTVDGDILTFDFVTTDDLEDKCQFKGSRRIIQPGIGD